VDNKYVHKTGMAVEVVTLPYVTSEFLTLLQGRFRPARI